MERMNFFFEGFILDGIQAQEQIKKNDVATLECFFFVS